MTTLQTIFTATPANQWAPKTPWGTDTRASIGRFSLRLQSDGKIAVTVGEAKPFGTLYPAAGGWKMSTAKRDGVWAAGVAQFETLDDACAWLVARS